MWRALTSCVIIHRRKSRPRHGLIWARNTQSRAQPIDECARAPRTRPVAAEYDEGCVCVHVRSYTSG